MQRKRNACSWHVSRIQDKTTTEIINRSFENVARLKYSGIALKIKIALMRI
jgi:hypothetical protein